MSIQEQETTKGELREKVQDLEAKIDDAMFLAKRSQQEASDALEVIEEKDKRIAELEERVEALEDRDTLMQEVHKNSANTATERAVMLVRKLNNEAIAKQRDGLEGTSSLTVKEARKALRGDGIDVQREKLYYTFEKAEELVENNAVLDYKKEPRTSEKNSRLRLDLEAGDLPSMIDGFEVEPTTKTEVAG